jgi:nitrate/nitrite transporter NarK
MSPVRAEPSPASAWVVLGVSALLFASSQFHRVAGAVVAQDLQRDLALSSEGLGIVGAAFFYAFAAGQLPLAVLLDRLGARRTMAALSLVGAVGALVFATASGRSGATVGRVLLGLGMAGNLMGSLKLIGHWFSPRRFATMSGVVAGFGALGNILATTPLAVLVGAIGWRRSFVAIAVVTAALAVLFWILARERPGSGQEGGEPAMPVGLMARRLFGDRDYWLISLGAFCRYGSFVAIQGLWAAPFLAEVAGLSAIASANLILLLNVAFIVGSPIGGWLSDRVLSSRKNVMLLALAGTAVAVLALALAGPGTRIWMLGAILVLLGGASAFGQIVYAHIRQLMPPRMEGMAMTGVNVFTMLGGAVFLHGMGWAIDRQSAVLGQRGPEAYRTTFIACSAVVAAALGLYLFTRDRPRGDGSRAPPPTPTERA